MTNKSKTNHDHLETILDNKVFNTRKHKILYDFCNNDIDIRQMTMLKNELFECEDLIDNHLVKQDDWDETKERLQIFNIDKVESLLLQEIK